jgi:hypothetical protein
MHEPGRKRISIQHLWVMAMLVCVFAFVNTHPIRPHDFWWHLAVGQEIAATKAIPKVDTYSYTMAGRPYASYSMFWLADIGLFAVYKLGGVALNVFIQSLMLTLTYAIILWLCWRASHSWRIGAFGGLFAAALGFEDWNLRPQIVSFLLGAVFLLAIYEYRRRPRKAWLAVFPAGMVVWVNSHGAFPVGLGLLVLWFLDDTFRIMKARAQGADSGRGHSGIQPALAALVMAALATLVNPRGIGILHYLTTLTGNPAVQRLVPEWAPPSFATLGGSIFLVGLLLSAVVLALSPRRPGFFQIVSLVAFAGLALKTSRGIVWYGMVMAPVLSEHAAALSRRTGWGNLVTGSSRGIPLLNMVFVGLFLFMAFVSLPWFKADLPLPEKKAGLISAETPIRATQFLLDENPPTELFNAMSFGSYLIWAAAPEYRVFVDGRIELYPVEIWRDYLRISNAQCGWQRRLEHYGVKTLMLSPREQPALVDSVRASSDWEMLYEDPHAVIFVRQEARSQGNEPSVPDHVKWDRLPDLEGRVLGFTTRSRPPLLFRAQYVTPPTALET